MNTILGEGTKHRSLEGAGADLPTSAVRNSGLIPVLTYSALGQKTVGGGGIKEVLTKLEAKTRCPPAKEEHFWDSEEGKPVFGKEHTVSVTDAIANLCFSLDKAHNQWYSTYMQFEK